MDTHPHPNNKTYDFQINGCKEKSTDQPIKNDQ